MANIITLTGASQCGKSFVRKLFLEVNSNDFKPVLFKKYTTRANRVTDDDVVCVEKIPDNCDIVYEQYGNRYGFRFDDLYNHLVNGESPIVVVNDVRAVEDLRAAIGSQVVSLFIYRRPPQLKAFEDEELARVKGRGKDAQELAIRAAKVRNDKAVAIHRIYIENIHLFDNVILNISGAMDKTAVQVSHIVKKLTKSVEGLV